MTIGDDGIASICMGQKHDGNPCARCGHAPDARTVAEIAEEIATYIIKDGPRIPTLKFLLLEFAEEIKRKAIEP
jgi:hypothetical protein